MSWLRIDDGFASHPKVTQLTDSQKWVWMRVLCYCARYQSPSLNQASVKEISGLNRSLVLRLVELCLLDESGSTWEVHDWKDYQPKDITGAKRQADWRNRHNAEVTAGVTADSVTDSLPRAIAGPVPSLRDTQPLRTNEEPARLTEADVARAREARERSGWVENLSSYTGCRYVRGTHGVTAVYDVLGTERAPEGWTYAKPTRVEVVAALKGAA